MVAGTADTGIGAGVRREVTKPCASCTSGRTMRRAGSAFGHGPRRLPSAARQMMQHLVGMAYPTKRAVFDAGTVALLATAVTAGAGEVLQCEVLLPRAGLVVVEMDLLGPQRTTAIGAAAAVPQVNPPPPVRRHVRHHE